MKMMVIFMDDNDWGFSPATIHGRHERSLSIDAMDLARFEESDAPKKGRSFTSILMSIQASRPGAERDRVGNSLYSQVSAISNVLADKTRGRFRLGILQGNITTIDTQAPPALLQIGAHEYPILHPSGSRGFSNSQRIKIAEAGLAGLPEEYLEPRTSSRSLRVKASQANESLAHAGFPFISFSFIAGKIYLFDFSQQAHLYKRAKLRDEIKKTSPNGGSQTKAEKIGWKMVMMAAKRAKAGYDKVPVRGQKTCNSIAKPQELTCE